MGNFQIKFSKYKTVGLMENKKLVAITVNEIYEVRGVIIAQ